MGGLLILDVGDLADAALGRSVELVIWIGRACDGAFGAVGFADDYLRSSALAPRIGIPPTKMVRHVVVALAGRPWPCCCCRQQKTALYNTRLIFPFCKTDSRPGMFYIASRWWCSSARATRSNLTDASTARHSARSRCRRRIHRARLRERGTRCSRKYLLLVRFAPAGELTSICGALVGASLGFLVQLLPCRHFHGQRRVARASGARSARGDPDQAGAAAPDGRRRRFVIEARSVIIQVASFKLTGQRVSRWRRFPPPLRADRVERPKVSRLLILRSSLRCSA